jgi:hypothetical protein
VQTLLLLLVILSTVLLGGCEVVGDIFQAGMAAGVIVVVLIIGALVFLARKVM